MRSCPCPICRREADSLQGYLRMLAAVCFGGAAIVALLILGLSGCGTVIYEPWIPRDGSPVLLELGPGIPIETAERAAAIWEPAGVRFVTTGGDDTHVIRIELSADLAPEAIGSFTVIAPFVVRIRTGYEGDAMTLAHELGHTLGLSHVAQLPCAVMSPAACSPTLTDADLAEFARTQF